MTTTSCNGRNDNNSVDRNDDNDGRRWRGGDDCNRDDGGSDSDGHPADAAVNLALYMSCSNLARIQVYLQICLTPLTIFTLLAHFRSYSNLNFFFLLPKFKGPNLC